MHTTGPHTPGFAGTRRQQEEMTQKHTKTLPVSRQANYYYFFLLVLAVKTHTSHEKLLSHFRYRGRATSKHREKETRGKKNNKNNNNNNKGGKIWFGA